MKEIISTQNAPAAIGPYSQGVKAGNLLFVSGQIPLDPATGEAQVVPVTTGFSDGRSVQILSGLEEGDVVLIESRVKS